MKMWMKFKKFRLVYFGTLCAVFIVLLLADFFIPKYPLKTSKYILKKSSWLKEKILIPNTNVYSRYKFNLNGYNFVLTNDTDFNTRGFFVDESNTFHKIFQTWLQNRLVKNPLTLQFTLKPKDSCKNQGHNLSTLIAVTSKPSHIESRLAIRDTWGNIARKMGAKVLFFLGQPPNTKYHAKIMDENNKFQDIIQTSFKDTYANLTLKTISVLKWVSEVCPLVKYVLKVDDDMFLNVGNIMNITSNQNISMTILGELAHRWPPVRSTKSKFYASYQEYPFDIYPEFVFGPSYLLSGDAIQILYESSIRMNIFHLEDVYITGFVAERENVSRKNLPAMFNTIRDLQPCQFKKLISSHGHTAHDIRRHWMWLNRRNFQCVRK